MIWGRVDVEDLCLRIGQANSNLTKHMAQIKAGTFRSAHTSEYRASTGHADCNAPPISAAQH